MAADLPEKMTACQVVEFKKPYEINEVSVPKEVGPFDILVKTAVASYCHTDSMVSKGDMESLGGKPPITGSHEGAGTVVQVGSEVKDYKAGDRIMAGLPYKLCGHCSDCLGPEKYKHYCENKGGFVGVTMDGAFADYFVADSRTSAHLPDAVSFETAAPMACAGSTIWRAVLQSGVKSGEWLALVGSGGGLGHLGTQFAKAKGIQVIGIDARDEGLELSKEAGADVIIDARKGKDSVVEEVKKVTGGKGADSAIVISDAKTASALSCAVTKLHGLVVQVAQPEEVIVPFHEFVFRDIRMQGSLICSPEEAQDMLNFVAEHKIKVRANTFDGLKEIPKLVDLVHSGKMAGKGVVIVDPEQIKEQKNAGVELA